MKILQPGERATVSFNVPHPFDKSLVIECTADVKIVKKSRTGRPEQVRLFYVDPRHPDESYFSHSENIFIKFAPVDPVSIKKVREDRVWTREDYEWEIISQEVDAYLYNEIDEILALHGLTYEKKYDDEDDE